MKKIFMGLALILFINSVKAQIFLGLPEQKIESLMESKDAVFAGRKYNNDGELYLSYEFYLHKNGEMKDNPDLIGMAFYMGSNDTCRMSAMSYKEFALDGIMEALRKKEGYKRTGAFSWYNQELNMTVKIKRDDKGDFTVLFISEK